MSRSAFVFSTDETFAPLAKGLVLSMRAAASDGAYDLKLIDIGCSNRTLDWMRDHQVAVSKFDRAKFFPYSSFADLKDYQDAQLCRPFLPKIFHGYEVYLWCDSDIWVQQIDSINLYRDLALRFPEKVPVSPIIDVSYGYLYRNGAEFINYARNWYEAVYGPEIASQYAPRAILSSGLFAMTANNPLWVAWAHELRKILGSDITDSFARHLAEQTAFNYLLYARQQFIPLEALHNYNCHLGGAVRDASGIVSLEHHPARVLGVVHLSYASKMIDRYIDSGLLYEQGRYLDAGELAGLRKLAHY
jgi:hypothetical protein